MAKHPLKGSERHALPGAQATGKANPSERLEVSVILRCRQQAALQERVMQLAEGETPPSCLSRDDFARQFGADPDDIATVRAFAGNHDLNVVQEDAARRTVILSGTVAQFDQAFAVDLQQFHHPGGSYRGRTGSIHLPDELIGIVEAVLGLDNRPQAQPHFRSLPLDPTHRGKVARPAAGSNPRSFTPLDLAKLYRFPPGSGQGQCIGLIELGGGYRPADLTSYFASLSITPPKVTTVSVDHGRNDPTGDANGPDGEVMLDIEVAGALAPEAHIVVYFAPNTDAGFLDAITTAIHDTTNKPSVISISWGRPEAGWTQQSLAAFDTAFQAAATMGITITAASGDSGSDDGVGDGAAHVDFPASSPYVLACGGTSLDVSGGKIARETVWNNGADNGASGGGVSAIFALPPYQKGLTVAQQKNAAVALAMRGVPDVAAVADPRTGYALQVDGSQVISGGTSAVAPLWAGLIARLNATRGAPLGYLHDQLYQHAKAFNDITAGDNGDFAAAPGWDACTGLGSPDGTALAAALTGSPAGHKAAAKDGRREMSSKKAGSAAKSPAAAPTSTASGDQPFFDPTPYGNGPDDAVTDATENAAITHHEIVLDGRTIAYTATAGHLVTVDPSSSLPNAKMFYVAFTADGVDHTTRPVTFFYNGGPGSSAVFVLLGSFGPIRIKTSMPGFTPPAPYKIEPNTDSLLDKSDLIFINPVGTGYSAAIAPKKNRDFWGVDQDAASIKQFIKRYLTANDRWNSPKFLFGESYGTARSAVLSYALHEDGIDLNGVTLQSSILDYTQAGNPIGLLPTCAADAWYHKKVTVKPVPADLPSFMQAVMPFASGDYATALKKFPKADPTVVHKLSQYTGIDETTLTAWSLDVAAVNSSGASLFLLSLLQDKGLALGAYDGRVTGIDTGIAGEIDPNSGGNDPTMTAVNGVYTAMWNSYLNDDLKFTSNSSFTDLNDQAFLNWNFGHIDPTGAQKGLDKKGNVILYTAGDLAATMSLNIDLKVFSANGCYDSVTPFYQTALDLQNMPLVDANVRKNLTIKNYPSGHMIYLDGASRTAMKADLAAFYESTVADRPAMARILQLQARHRHA